MSLSTHDTYQDSLSKTRRALLESAERIWNKQASCIVAQIPQPTDDQIYFIKTTTEGYQQAYEDFIDVYTKYYNLAVDGQENAQTAIRDALKKYVKHSAAQRLWRNIQATQKEVLPYSAKWYCKLLDLQAGAFFEAISDRTLGEYRSSTDTIDIYIHLHNRAAMCLHTIEHELTHAEQRLACKTILDILTGVRTSKHIPAKFIPFKPHTDYIPVILCTLPLGSIIVWLFQQSQTETSWGLNSAIEFEADQAGSHYLPCLYDHLKTLKKSVFDTTKHSPYDILKPGINISAHKQHPPTSPSYPNDAHLLLHAQWIRFELMNKYRSLVLMDRFLKAWHKTHYQYQRSFCGRGYHFTVSRFPCSYTHGKQLNIDAYEPCIEFKSSNRDALKALYSLLVLILPIGEPITRQVAIGVPGSLHSLCITTNALPFIRRYCTTHYPDAR